MNTNDINEGSTLFKIDTVNSQDLVSTTKNSFNAKQELSKLTQMEKDNTYHCNYPQDSDPSQISSADLFTELIPDRVSPTLVRYTVPRHGDLITEFTFFSKEKPQDFSIQLVIGKYLVYSVDVVKESLYRITPTKGIPHISLPYQDVYIYINGKDVNNLSVFQRTLYLSYKDRRRLVTDKIEMLDGDYIEKGMYHSTKNEWSETTLLHNILFKRE